MALDGADSEDLRPGEGAEPAITIKGNAVNPLFGPNTHNYEVDRNHWQYKGYDTLDSTSFLSTIVYDGQELNFNAELVNTEVRAMSALVPFDTDLGYTIDNRDFDPNERMKKIAENYPELIKPVGKNDGLVRLRIRTARVIAREEALCLADRSAVMVSTPEGKFIGRLALIKDSPTLECVSFSPLDAPPLPRTNLNRNQMLEFLGKEPGGSVPEEYWGLMDAINDAPSAFNLLLPNDPEILSQINVEFLVDSQVPQL
jgi:hypothetical protein